MTVYANECFETLPNSVHIKALSPYFAIVSRSNHRPYHVAKKKIMSSQFSNTVRVPSSNGDSTIEFDFQGQGQLRDRDRDPVVSKTVELFDPLCASVLSEVTVSILTEVAI